MLTEDSQPDSPPIPEPIERRLRELEWIAADYARLKPIIERTAHGGALEQSSDFGALYVDLITGRVIDANRAIADLLGWGQAELIGQPIESLEESAAEAEPEASRRYVENGNEIRIYPALFRHRDGHTIPVRVNCRQLNKPDGALRYYQIEDRSLPSLLREALRQRDDVDFQFASRLKVLNEITIALSRIDDFDDLCRAIVQAGIENLGFDRIGMWFHDPERALMVGSFGTDETGHLRDERGESWRYEDTYIMEYLQGKVEAAYTLYDAPLYDHHHQVIEHGWHIAAPMLDGERFVGMLMADNYRHKHPMKNFEPELLRLYGIVAGQLTALLRARERAFVNRLDHARTQVIGQFVAAIGHDFRTPLAVINTRAYLLARSDDPAQRRTLMEDVQAQVQQINTILTAMLEFVAIQSDLEPRPEAVDLAELVEQAAQPYRALCAENDLRLTLEGEPGLIVQADPERLLRAVSELIQNACEHTPPGGQVRVSLVRHDSAVGIHVTDTGIGIAPDQVDRIFQPLYRVDQARTERRSGLGLAIVRSIVEAHHGQIAVTSTPGSGSTFAIRLPLR